MVDAIGYFECNTKDEHGKYLGVHRILEKFNIRKNLLFTVYIRYSTCWMTIKSGRLRD